MILDQVSNTQVQPPIIQSLEDPVCVYVRLNLYPNYEESVNQRVKDCLDEILLSSSDLALQVFPKEKISLLD